MNIGVLDRQSDQTWTGDTIDSSRQSIQLPARRFDVLRSPLPPQEASDARAAGIVHAVVAVPNHALLAGRTETLGFRRYLARLIVHDTESVDVAWRIVGVGVDDPEFYLSVALTLD